LISRFEARGFDQSRHVRIDNLAGHIWNPPMMNKTLPILTAGLLILTGGWNVITAKPAAASAPTEVISVDPANSTITIDANGQTTTYHLDPLGTVYKNGQKASLKDLGPGMVVSSLSLSDPTSLSELKVSETAQPASGPDGAPLASNLPVDELKELKAKVDDSYWTNSPTSWFYLAPDGNLVDTWHESSIGKWTLSDRYTLLILDNGKQLHGKQAPTLYKFNASYTVAGPWIRQPVPTQEMKDRIAKLHP
jgi:hypothetical protein